MVDADVIIVGFRCAGAPLAYALQRAGAKVIVVEKDAFFTDQPLSTHAIAPYGMMMFDRLGLGDVVRGLAPRCPAFRLQLEDSYMQVDLDGTVLDSRTPRRSKLDPALQKAAIAAGVDAYEKTRVIALLSDGARVTGVRVQSDRGERELRAPLVVGADGRNSTIARMVGAPAYLESETPNGTYWSYFEETPAFSRCSWGGCIHIEGQEARAVFQTDSGLLVMAGGGQRRMIETWRADPEAALMDHLRRGSLTAPLVEGSRMVSRPIGLISMRFFMKQAVGPGWALVGDAGLHIDPTPGLGISDAARDALALSEAIVDGSERAMLRYWRRRDADSIGLYHFAGDMSSEDYNNPFTRMVYARTQRTPKLKKRMSRMMRREVRPLDMIPAATLLGWIAAETLSGNFALWPALRRTLRTGTMVRRQQAILDRALRSAEHGNLDHAVPSLPG